MEREETASERLWQVGDLPHSGLRVPGLRWGRMEREETASEQLWRHRPAIFGRSQDDGLGVETVAEP